MKYWGLDVSAGGKDSTAVVVIDYTDTVFNIVYAKTFPKIQFFDLAVKLKAIKSQINGELSPLIVESNGVGAGCLEIIQKSGLGVVGMVTVGKIAQNSKAKNYSMGKSDMMKYFLQVKQSGKIKFPYNTTNEDILELKTQISNITRHVTQAGNESFYASGSSSDDLFMAMLITIWYIKKENSFNKSKNIPIVTTLHHDRRPYGDTPFG